MEISEDYFPRRNYHSVTDSREFTFLYKIWSSTFYFYIPIIYICIYSVPVIDFPCFII